MHKIRENILKIIVKDLRKELLPLPVSVIKSAQGFNYSETTCLLCPQIYLDMFKNDDKYSLLYCSILYSNVSLFLGGINSIVKA